MSSDPLPDIGTIHERLAYARRRAGLTQVRLARDLGIGERTLQSYESGETKVPAALVPRVERLAGIPPGWILYDGPSEDWEKRRRLPPGSGLVSMFFVVGALLFPTPGVAMSCKCSPLMSAREPRVKLATRNRRETAPRGRRRPPPLGTVPADD